MEHRDPLADCLTGRSRAVAPANPPGIRKLHRSPSSWFFLKGALERAPRFLALTVDKTPTRNKQAFHPAGGPGYGRTLPILAPRPWRGSVDLGPVYATVKGPKAVIGDQVAVEKPPSDQPSDRIPHLLERS